MTTIATFSKETKEETKETTFLYDAIPDYNERVYDIIQTYFEGHHTERLVRHQIESYNDFVTVQIQKTIQMFNPIRIHSENDYIADKEQYYLEIDIQFDNLRFHPPTIHENNGATKKMMPQEAKLRNITYASNMTLDMNIQYLIRNTENMDEPKIIPKKMTNISIGKMPIMLKSVICALQNHAYPLSLQNADECQLDCGGYFILKGSEKTVLGQERTAENKIYCFDGKNTTKWNWMAEMKSVPDYKCISPKQIEMMISNKNGALYIQIPRIKIPIELFTLYRALGIIADKKICEYICFHVNHEKTNAMMDFLTASITDAGKYMTQEAALTHIVSHVAYTPINIDRDNGQKRKREFALEVLRTDLLPHCTTLTQKLYLLGMMASKLIRTSFGWLAQDDRDSYLNKRIELTGTLLNNLFRNYYNKLLKEMQKLVLREINTSSWRSTHDYENIINMTNIYKLIKPATIENGVNRALSTGDFSIKQMNSSKVGVAQVLNRLTYPATLSHMRRINTPIEKSGELIPPRKLHNTTWGYLCLAGDTDVLSSNRMDMRKIKDMKDGQWVTTVNRETLEEEPSDISHFFGKMPDQLFEITTISGRTIKATAEHPFLVKMPDGKYEMKKVEDLQLTDRVVIRHMVKSIPDEQGENATQVILKTLDIEELQYYPTLMEQQWLNQPIQGNRLKIIARLLALSIMGQGKEGQDDDIRKVSIQVQQKKQALQLDEDIQTLGFGRSTIRPNYSLKSVSWIVSKGGAFAYLMELMRGPDKNRLPEWLIHAERSIQREFLSAFQAMHGGTLWYEGTNRKNGSTCIARLCSTEVKTQRESLPTIMASIVDMFQHFQIQCRLDTEPLHKSEDKVKAVIRFEQTSDNILRYVDTILNNSLKSRFAQVSSPPIIELLKVQAFGAVDITEEWIHTFFENGTTDTGCVCVPLFSIREIEPEMVYDFTTRSVNHSFVASSYVCSNCPQESPEGASVGVVKNLAYMAHITIPSNSSALYDYVKPFILPLEDVSDPTTQVFEKVKVLVNGCFVGVTSHPMELLQDMRHKKRCGVINVYTSIVFDFPLAEIRLCADGGRLCRPVLRVQDNHLVLTSELLEQISNKALEWNDLMVQGLKWGESIIEYIDPDEQSFSLIAMNTKKKYMMNWREKQYTHAEIHPSTCMGILASCIPFPEHNQAPRNTYQTAMQKQAMGIYATNYDKRMDKTGYILTYPMRPLVDTRVMNFIHLNEVPSGCQIFVAIMTHTGYNQEDSVLINKGAIDRGLFVTTIFHTEKDEDKNVVRDEIIRCKPDKVKTRGIKFGNYEKLNSKGFIPENTLVENRDVIIAKVTPIKENRNDPSKIIKYEDQSKVFRTTEETYIDKNITGRNGDGYNFAKTRTRIFRKPVIGDKFASRSSQKGTLGNIIAEEDMPFTKEGLRPDLILNPHAIPSRMTIAQLKETLLGKLLLELGMFGDGTAFSELSMQTIMEELQKVGFESCGNEIMYSGETGRQLETSVFVGPVFYQRLKHMVNDKQHSRSIGPMVNLTRQPAEGRCRDGGFRIGEMERDVMIGHGMSEFCKERLMDASDKYSMHVCRKCGLTASYNDGQKKSDCLKGFQTHLCSTCENRTEFARVEIPYTYKLLMQELQTVNIATRFITE